MTPANDTLVKQGSPEDGYIPRRCFFCKHFVFLLTWLVCWTWPKLYSTTGYFPILILEKEPVFPFSMLSTKQRSYWYHFYNVYGMTRSLTGDWTRDLPHSKPALLPLGYRGGSAFKDLCIVYCISTNMDITFLSLKIIVHSCF